MLPVWISLSLAFWASSFAAGNEIQMFGISGESVRLPCDLRVADPPLVEWSDMVYNLDDNPSIIFQSENNPDFSVKSTHPKRLGYIIDSDYALTIDALDLDSDAGQYTCRSTVRGVVHERRYFLTVGELPSCTGSTRLLEGNSTSLVCEMSYSGQNPALQWYHNDDPIESQDEFEIRLAKKVLPIVATSSHDQSKYTCRMSLGDVTKECSLTLDVKYLVRDLKFSPSKEKFRVGDELHCSAKGNPVPSIHLLSSSSAAAAASGQGGKAGHGLKTFIIGQSLEGQRVQLQCTASNSVGSIPETITSNLTIHVAAQKKSHTTTLTTTSSNRAIIEEVSRTFHHVRHTNTPPGSSVGRKDKDHTKPPHQRKSHHPHHHHQHSTTVATPLGDDVRADGEVDEEENVAMHVVTHRLNSEKTEPTKFRKAEGKETHIDSKHNPNAPQTTGQKPVQGSTSQAGQMCSFSRSAIYIVLFTIVSFVQTLFKW